jgi:hypothetical protein
MGRVPEEQRPRFRLTERDRDIVLAVYQYRVLTTNQIETLFFRPKEGTPKSLYNSRCRLRLQALYHAGYLRRDEQPQKMTEGRKPLLYSLDMEGAKLVSQIYDVPLADLEWRPKAAPVSPFTLEHLLATNDVRVLLQTSVGKHGLEISRWIDDHTLRQKGTTDYVILKSKGGTAQRVSLVPDGYFILENQEVRHHQFLEIDMGTMTGMYAKYGRRDWARKVAAYLEYYRSGKYLERYHTKSMRVLTVTTSDRRLANLKGVTEKVGGKGRFWFTTFDRLKGADILTDPIWSKAGSSDLHALI